MRVVLDTNVVAYFLLGTARFAAEARIGLEAATEAFAPAHWEAELTNVVWMAVGSGVLTPAEGSRRLRLARKLGIDSVPLASLCEGALSRSVESGLSAYDSLCIELAARLECPLATFDGAVLTAFPHVAVRPRDLAK